MGNIYFYNILKYCDEIPKIIVMLRNPVEMAESLHFQQIYSLNESSNKKATNNVMRLIKKGETFDKVEDYKLFPKKKPSFSYNLNNSIDLN